MARGPNYRSNKQYRVRVGGAVNLRKQQAKMNMDIRYLKSLVNSEMKYVYSTYTGQAISSTGTIYHLSAVAQGDTINQRDGNSIMPRYLNLNIRLQSQTNDTVRMLIFRWKDNSTPVVSSIVEDASAPVYSPLNDNISGNRKDRGIDVIKNKLFVLDNVERKGQLYKKTIDLNPPSKNIKDHCKFDNTLTTNEHGGIYMLLIGRQPTTTTDFEGSHKLSFLDN